MIFKEITHKYKGYEIKKTFDCSGYTHYVLRIHKFSYLENFKTLREAKHRIDEYILSHPAIKGSETQ